MVISHFWTVKLQFLHSSFTVPPKFLENGKNGPDWKWSKLLQMNVQWPNNIISSKIG